MRIVLDIDAQKAGGPRAMAAIAREYLKGLMFYDQILIRRGLVAPMVRSFIQGRLVFQAEPNAGEFEEFADAWTVQDRGWGDCDDLVPWRCAEWREYRGVLAMPKVYWRCREHGPHCTNDRDDCAFAYHAEVRLPCACHQRLECQDAPVEDISTFLGMARRRREAA